MVYEITEFTAPWCNACKKLEPFLAVAKKRGVTITKIDVDERPEVAQQCNVSSLPTLIFMKNGDRVRVTTGVTAEIVQLVSSFGLPE